MKITNLDKIEKVTMTMEGAKDVLKQVPLSKKDGAPNFSFRVFTILPGGHTPYHTHGVEHMNYIIEGEGAMVDAAGGEQPLQARAISSWCCPTRSTSTKTRRPRAPVVMICAVPKEYE